MQCRVLSSRMKRIEKGFRSEQMFVAWRIALAAQARSCKASASTSETMQYIGIFKQTPVSVDRCAEEENKTRLQHRKNRLKVIP